MKTPDILWLADTAIAPPNGVTGKIDVMASDVLDHLAGPPKGFVAGYIRLDLTKAETPELSSGASLAQISAIHADLTAAHKELEATKRANVQLAQQVQALSAQLVRLER